MISYHKLLFILIFAVLATGCATVGVVAPTIDGLKGTIKITRPSGASGGLGDAITVVILLDGRDVAVMGIGMEVAFDAIPGEHTLSIHASGAMGTFDTKIMVEEGETARFRVLPIWGPYFMIPGAFLFIKTFQIYPVTE